MSDIFLSYASEDRRHAKVLAHALESRGWSVWWDRKIIVGKVFDQVIEKELEEAKSVVVLWSTNSVDSEWVKTEAAVARDRGVLVPAMIETVKLPLAFRRKQTADLTDWNEESDHSGFQALSDGVSATITGEIPPQRPTFPAKKSQLKRSWLLVTATMLVLLIGTGVVWQIYSAKTDAPKVTSVPTSEFKKDIYKQLRTAQSEAVRELGIDKSNAIRLIDQNLADIDRALKSFPDDPIFHTLKGYAAKDVYQSSKGLLSKQKRLDYLAVARQSFEKVLKIDPDSPGAHNGMGNVLFFEGEFEAALRQHKKALRLANGNYPSAKHDMELVEKVIAGEIPFNY